MKEKTDVKNIIIIVESVIISILLFFIIILLITNNNGKSTSGVTINTNNKSSDGSITISKNNDQVKNDTIKLNLNETVTKEEKYELTVLGINFGKTILPPNTSSFYNYYEAKADGHQYLEVKFNYKNLGETNAKADGVVSMTIKYNDKYEYTGFSVIEDSESDFVRTYGNNIAPLTTGKMHYLFDVPDEVANSEGSIVAKMKCGNDVYEIVLR